MRARAIPGSFHHEDHEGAAFRAAAGLRSAAASQLEAARLPAAGASSASVGMRLLLPARKAERLTAKVSSSTSQSIPGGLLLFQPLSPRRGGRGRVRGHTQRDESDWNMSAARIHFYRFRVPLRGMKDCGEKDIPVRSPCPHAVNGLHILSRILFMQDWCILSMAPD